jgi:hypothetical protein
MGHHTSRKPHHNRRTRLGVTHAHSHRARSLAFVTCVAPILASYRYGTWFWPFWKSAWNVFDLVVVINGVINMMRIDLGELPRLSQAMRTLFTPHVCMLLTVARALCVVQARSRCCACCAPFASSASSDASSPRMPRSRAHTHTHADATLGRTHTHTRSTHASPARIDTAGPAASALLVPHCTATLPASCCGARTRCVRCVRELRALRALRARVLSRSCSNHAVAHLA